MHHVNKLVFVLLLSSVACGELPEVDGLSARQDGIVNGTRTPQNTFLNDHQTMAVGYLADPWGDEFCTGTLISPNVVVTAQHCTEHRTASSTKFGIGLFPADPVGLLDVAEIHEHSYIDFAILILAQSGTDYYPALEPIAINREPLSYVWDNRWVDAVGFGDTYSSDSGRFFASVQITDYDSTTVSVDGHGEQGICYGDSGGPIIWQPDAATDPVVVGTEQWGDASCVDVDHLTRVDVVASWLDEVVDGLPTPQGNCGDVTYEGECRDDVVAWCQGGSLYLEDCSLEGTHCGWRGTSTGYDCLPAACDQIDYFGECSGTVLTWCSADGLRSVDCADQNRQCVWVDEENGHNCGGCYACDGVCTDIETSVDHCGKCGFACDPAHATPVCEQGRCAIGECEAGYADADGDAANGCEAEDDEGGCAATDASPWTALVLIPVLLWRRRRR